MDFDTINLINNKMDESNYFWIKNLLEAGINNLITKWVNGVDPFRLVWIQSNQCHICEATETDVWCESTDDFNGRHNNVGWIYCKKCTKLMALSKYHYEKKQTYLTYSQTRKLRRNKYRFWRVSSNPKISPHMQKEGDILQSLGNTLCIMDKTDVIGKKLGLGRIITPIRWECNGEYNKTIFLSNLIQFNRNLLGYNIKHLPVTNLNKNWITLINREYAIANKWSEIIVILIKKNIPNGIIRNICSIWGGFTKFI